MKFLKIFLICILFFHFYKSSSIPSIMFYFSLVHPNILNLFIEKIFFRKIFSRISILFLFIILFYKII